MKTLGEKPMMSDAEIQIVDDLIDKHQPKLCLEWGSGASTCYFPKHKSIKKWTAIEHDGNILDLLHDKLPDNVETMWILEGSSYADCVQRTHVRYDFILIDGLDRQKCLENALEIVSQDGIILLHDAGRIDYLDFIEKHKGEIISEGEKPVSQGGFAHRGLALFRSPYGA